METDFWNNFWTALGVFSSLGVSSVAIWISLKSYKQTKKQIELSNKQQLFEKRLRTYLEIEKMAMTYKKFNEYSFYISNINNEMEAMATIVVVYPCSVGAQFNLTYTDIEKVDFDEVRRKIRELELVSKEFNFLFSNKLMALEKFMNKYVTFLSKVVDYQESVIFIKDIDTEKAKIAGTSESIIANSERENRISFFRAMEEVETAYDNTLSKDYFGILRNEIKIINNKKSH
ncbi:hypothetical protein ET004_09730 [Lactococcus petauri]|uniref:hypothetical protein n=1 Tax=Lactococcus petauri TaxID=1940789 RepID=UPI0013FDC16D|nr:hypothetical protein [Lactococcus petauri]NHI72481.1 hypothetical protein [Lactococcus petauri]